MYQQIFLTVLINLVRLDVVATYTQSHDVIHTTNGDVRGRRVTVLGRDVDVYWGIPYAKTPPERFRPPEPVQPWNGVLDALTPPPACPEVPNSQRLIPLLPAYNTQFHEDCLYLNLWVPRGCPNSQKHTRYTRGSRSFRGNATRYEADDEKEEGSLAVMVWIHGGSFEFGSSADPTYNGQVLAATQCVIVATMNYRLGPLGFLTFGTEEAPGNVGLMDQALALAWIRDNAPSFGGSRRRITLFGQSAGAVSVAAHMVSPVSRDLFARAILMSGTPIANPIHKSIEQAADSARRLASLAGCVPGDDGSLLDCLKRVDAIQLGLFTKKLSVLERVGLVVDGSFLRERLPTSFQNPNKTIPFIIGATKDDGSIIYSLLIDEENPDTPTSMSSAEFRSNVSIVIQPLAARPFPVDKPEGFAAVLDFLEDKYLDRSVADFEPRLGLDKMITDMTFVCPMFPTAEAFLGRSEVFMYSFQHRSSVSPFPPWLGVVHCSELDFVFGRPLDQRGRFTERERRLSMTMMKAWANFAKTGNPNPKWASLELPNYWPSLTPDQSPYAVLGRSAQDDVSVQRDRLRGCPFCSFWNDLYPVLASAFDTPA